MSFGYQLEVALLLSLALSHNATALPDFDDSERQVHDRKFPEFLYCPLRYIVNGRPTNGSRPDYASVQMAFAPI